MALVQNLGSLWAEYSKFRIKTPRLEEATEAFNSLRKMKRLAPHSEQRCCAIFAPSASGKSTTIRMYIENVLVPELIEAGKFPRDMPVSEIARLQNTVLHVTLSSPATSRSLAADILFALGDPRWDNGSANSLAQRANTLLQRCGTELVIIDEVQHLSSNVAKRSDGKTERSNVAKSTTVTDKLKTMLIDGLVPLVFVGLPEAEHHLMNDIQISGRCPKKLNFMPLDYESPSDQTIYVEFCGRLGLKIGSHELFEERTNLVEGDIPACLHEVAGGRLGMTCNVVQAACEVAYRENAKRVERRHLMEAVDNWAIPHGAIDYNPFREGIRASELRVN